MTIVNIQGNEQEKKQDTHKIGDFFVVDGDLCILARLSPSTVNLINLMGGNRYFDPVNVVNVDDVDVGLFKADSIIPVKSVSISYCL